jgi:hypothetical protein
MKVQKRDGDSKFLDTNHSKTYDREMGRLRTVDLLVLTSLDQLIFMLNILFTFITKLATLMKRSIVLSLPPQLVFAA